MSERLTEEDIVNRAIANQRKQIDVQRAAQKIMERAANGEPFRRGDFVDRKRALTLIQKRKVQPFHLVDPTPRTYVSGEEFVRRRRSEFEMNLIAEHVRGTRRRQLATAIVLLVFATCLAWLAWG